MVKRFKACVSLALAAVAVSTVSLLAIPLLPENAVYGAAVAFWLCLVLELVFLAVGSSTLKRILKKKGKTPEGKWGIITFFSNPAAKVFDILFPLALAAVIVITLLQVDSRWPLLLSLPTAWLSFHMHCILNGVLYKYLVRNSQHQHKRRERNE